MEIYENLNIEDLDDEIWKKIKEYDGDYFVSSLGRVKSFKRYHGTDIRILEPIEDGGGYLCVNLCKNNKSKPKRVHILMYKTFIEKIPEGYVVHHKDFTKNNFLDNFEMMDDKEHRKLHNKGENNPNVILTEKDVIQIRILLKEEVLTQKEIGEMFGVSISTISNIKTRKIWNFI